MKKNRILNVICITIALFVLIGCGKHTNSIQHEYLSASECAETLTSLDTYYNNISQKCLAFFMQEKGADVEQYIEHSANQARDFSEEEKKLLDKTIESIEEKMDKAGMKLPKNASVSIAKTTMNEALGAAGYTHGTTIFLCEEVIKRCLEDEVHYKDYLEELVAHELFHCLTRNNPEFRKEMYSFIGFTVTDSEFDIPEDVHKLMISNPDVGHHDSYATFTIDGEKKNCFLVFLSENNFENPGDSFFESMYTGLVDIEDGTLYSYKDASDFYDVVGYNTNYCEDPEECMATNFSYAIVYGIEGPDKQGYKTPEIIEKIISYMQN